MDVLSLIHAKSSIRTFWGCKWEALASLAVVTVTSTTAWFGGEKRQRKRVWWRAAGRARRCTECCRSGNKKNRASHVRQTEHAEPNRPDLMEGGKYCLSPLWFLFQHLFGGLSALWCLHKKLLSYSLSDENKLFVTLRFLSHSLSKGTVKRESDSPTWPVILLFYKYVQGLCTTGTGPRFLQISLV